MQQSLIGILVAILSTVSCSQLSLVPYAYLLDPLPVYHQSQDTRTGEHAYSYSGGPSAKEEVKGPDGVTRGSYSYVDARGILQSVFYVADEGGFRVAATNLPTDTDLPVETAEVLLAKRALFEEQAKVKSSSYEDDDKQSSMNLRRKRSTGEDKEDSKMKRKQEDSSSGKSYGALASFLVPGSVATATSHQSHLRIDQNVRTEGIEPIVANTVSFEAAVAAAAPVVPLLTDPIQLKTIDVIKSPVTVLAAKDYHQNRIQIHRNLGLEGEQHNKDAVKIETVQPLLTEVHTLVPEPHSVAILVHRPSLLTAVPFQPIAHTHSNDKIQIPRLLELPTLLHTIPLARSSQYRSQTIDSSKRIENVDDVLSKNLKDESNKEKNQDEAMKSS